MNTERLHEPKIFSAQTISGFSRIVSSFVIFFRRTEYSFIRLDTISPVRMSYRHISAISTVFLRIRKDGVQSDLTHRKYNALIQSVSLNIGHMDYLSSVELFFSTYPSQSNFYDMQSLQGKQFSILAGVLSLQQN